ncbi:T-cell surface glycoprotein CD4-like [Myiozetetes cayanensis]|uniref:T-cell surface glycoprotein CD4-like n=1 Tax=Myiozetetes cayanensis TaxID=478635 RepID=UPI00215E55EF|nr:T-cell surface glycoprotein CD4-like [Myiozetetes cayanensis]
MKSCSTGVSCTPAVFLVLHLGLISSMAQQIEQQIGIAGREVTLPCVPPGSSLPRHTAVTWMYSNTLIWCMDNNKIFKKSGIITGQFEVVGTNKQLKLWNFELSDAGIYTCQYGSHNVRTALHVFKLTVSLDGHFLQNEVPELTLLHNSPDPKPDLSITLFNSNNNRVTPEGENKSPQKSILYLKKLEATDSGTWVCHVHSDSPLINQNISFAVKVLGFQNPDMERKYATVDSTVILSWHLNFQKIKWNKGFTGQLNWKQQKSAKAHELLDFNVTALGEQHETKKTSHFLFEIPERKPESAIQVKLPKVHFNHSGHYQCQLAYKGRRVQSNIELVVMKVSANPAGPLSRGAKMTLICQVSGPLPPNAHLSWERVNGTQMDIKNSKQHEVKLEVNISAAGLWSCHLIEDNDRKISLHYHVEEAPVWINYVVTGASAGGSVLAFALVCLCIISGINWQRRRQREKRMAQARQYLLENKTCQCQHWPKK